MSVEWVRPAADLQRPAGGKTQPLTPRLGIAVSLSEERTRQVHAGVVFQTSEEGPFLLHLAFHAYLKREPFDCASAEHRWVELFVDPDRIDGVAAVCEMIWLRSGGLDSIDPIPYGVQLDAVLDDDGSFKYANASGLSCATFALTVIEHQLGLPLVERSTWPTSRFYDSVWHDGIVSGLREWRATLQRYGKAKLLTDEHIEKVRQEKGCARYRPEEIAAAAYLAKPDKPARFEECERGSWCVLCTLGALSPPTHPAYGDALPLTRRAHGPTLPALASAQAGSVSRPTD